MAVQGDGWRTSLDSATRMQLAAELIKRCTQVGKQHACPQAHIAASKDTLLLHARMCKAKAMQNVHDGYNET